MREPAIVGERPRLLGFLPARLFVAERPLSYVLLAWVLALIPSLLLSAVVDAALPGQGPQLPETDPLYMFVLLVIFAPVIETLIMGSVLLVLERLFGFLPALLLSAAGWGLAHSFQAAAWGLVIWWPFLIFSLTFLVWRRRSLALAFLLPMLVHGLQNLIPALLVMNGLE